MPTSCQTQGQFNVPLLRHGENPKLSSAIAYKEENDDGKCKRKNMKLGDKAVKGWHNGMREMVQHERGGKKGGRI
jgi:hypothetical protein